MERDMTTTTKIDKRVHSNVWMHNGMVFVGTEHMRSLTNVRLINTGGRIGRQLEVTRRDGTVHVIKQGDVKCFFIDGPIYDGECDGYTDGVRLLNNM
jgi:late competence protein required for DNA uptake (superfamily II DNA/RNA helicase)